jgi:endonuclease/exonuclease/phosphatase (EEP) superfamily protein YafD
MTRIVGWVNVVLTAVVMAAAVAAALALAGARVPPFDVLAHFAPFYVAAGLAGAVWAAIAGRGPVIAASVLAVIAGAVLVVPELRRDAGPAAAAAAPGQIKVIQFNADRRNADLLRVADWLRDQDADVVTVTEARHDLRDLLVRRDGWKVAGGAGDLMIFTRARYLRMTRPKPPLPLDANFVNATYGHPAGPMEIVTGHVSWPTDPKVPYQIGALEFVTAARPRTRMIFTGDLNATPWSQELRRLDRSFGLSRRDRAVPTWPAEVLGRAWPLPFLPIDHVYAGSGWATVKVERGPHLGSDHYPLIVTLAPAAPR